jgi:uncharacterized membrane protein YciS (DUF1049 family)
MSDTEASGSSEVGRTALAAAFARIAIPATSLSTLIFGIGFLPVNLWAAMTFQVTPRVHVSDQTWQTYAGRLDVPVPWWIFFTEALVCLVIVVACWRPERWPGRTVGNKTPVIAAFPVPLQVGAVSFLVSVSSFTAGLYYPPLGSASFYGVPTVGGALLGLVCLIWHRKTYDAPRFMQVAQAEFRPRRPAIARLALVGVFGVAIAGALAGVVLVLAEVVAIWFSGSTPVLSDVYQLGSTAYRGIMPFLTPAWVLQILNGVLAAIAIIARSEANWPRRWASLPAPGELQLPSAIGAVALSLVLAAMANSAFAPADEADSYLLSVVVSLGIVLGLTISTFVWSKRGLEEIRREVKTQEEALGFTD